MWFALIRIVELSNINWFSNAHGLAPEQAVQKRDGYLRAQVKLPWGAIIR